MPDTNPANNFVVSTGSNRLNSQGHFTATDVGQSSKVLSSSIGALTTIPFAAAGNSFYLSASSASLLIRPKGGEFVPYVQGTGLTLKGSKAFGLLEIQNPNNFPVAFQLFVGFDEFTDRRLFNVSLTTPNVAYPTYSKANTAVAVAITDLSGQGFFDINGNPWFALYRVALSISNLDTANTLLVQRVGTIIQNDLAIAAVFPQTSWIEPVSGSYALNVGGGNINALVHEIYAAIPPSSIVIP